MKNLIQLGERHRKLILQNDETSDGNQRSVSKDSIVDICFVVGDDMRMSTDTVAMTKNGTITRIDESGETVWTKNLGEIDESCSEGGWFDLTYVDPELVCLSRNGAMVTVSPTTGDAELIGVFDYGLETAAWSPDCEVLLMVTSAVDDEDESKTKPVLMTMNSQFEVMMEITIPKYQSAMTGDDPVVSVTWRPDGTLCAMSGIDADDSTRKVRIYKRESLDLHAIGRSEDASGAIVKNLQNSGLAWASPGCSQILAAVQRKGKKTQQVVFFESNGLRHRELILREDPSTVVKSLAWNSTSDLLGVVLREENGTEKVQLWHRCNYHWYMKREIRYPNLVVQQLKFDDEKAHEFRVILGNLEWREYHVRWDSSTTWVMDDRCSAFVVDGSSLNITPLEKALIPPPMFLNNVLMESPISNITFCHGTTFRGSLLIQMSNGSLSLLNATEGIASYSVTKIEQQESMDANWQLLRSLLAVDCPTSNAMKVVAIAPAAADSEQEKLVEILISIDESKVSASISKTFLLDYRVLRMVNWSDNEKGCIIELIDGSMLEYEPEGLIHPADAEPLLEPCPWICAIKDPSSFAETHDDSQALMIFGLSSKYRLYYHDIMLTESASSFYLSIHHDFLCYATTGSRCFIKFLPLKEVGNFDPLMGMDQNHLLEGYEPRSIERGARIVAILPSQPMAVLQMPRGNLEGIYPRALVVRSSMLRIHSGEYDEAFRMMRKHKVDLNVLVDFDPWHFCDEGIATFFRQVTVIDHLNLFLSGLQNYDITQERFPIPRWLRWKNKVTKDKSTFDFSNKVNHVCQKARSAMLAMEESNEVPDGHFLLPILSTYAKESPPKVDEALNMIKGRARKHHPPNSKKPPLFADKAQNAIHYLAFLAEYELLFETALGMYDYEIARAVARNSQMDPKIYLPLLKRLNNLPPNYAKFEVDMRLKRYEKALTNLFYSSKGEEKLDGFQSTPEIEGTLVGNSFEDCMALIVKRKLFKLALNLYTDDQPKIRKVLISLGNSLLEDHEPKIALTTFLAADPPAVEEALVAARAAKDWKTFFSLLSRETDSDGQESDNGIERRRQIARDIAKELVSDQTEFSSISKQALHSDSARILLDYGDDLFGAVDMLIAAQCWIEAHRLAINHGRPDLVKKCQDSAIEHAYSLLDDFDEKVSTFETTSERYSQVLLLRKKNIIEEGPVLNEADETGSLFSAASNMSNMSLQSATSTSSTGSATSSIISVKTATTFTMTNNDDKYRHRSKFNKGKKAKAKKKKKQKNRRKPGSQEELNSLVFTLKYSCPNDEYAGIITATIQYLIQSQQLTLATEVYKRYNKMQESIKTFQHDRIQQFQKDKEEAERQARDGVQEHGNVVDHYLLQLPEESEVDSLHCKPLDSSLLAFFGYLMPL